MANRIWPEKKHRLVVKGLTLSINLRSMKSVDLFSGAGGLSLGLHMAGFTPKLALKIEDNYSHSIKHNSPDIPVLNQDIRNVSVQDVKEIAGVEIGELDLLAGGPPCQGFSVNAPVRDLKDPRNQLFYEFLRLADGIRPKAVLIENVPGVISLGRGTVVQKIYGSLQNLVATGEILEAAP